MKILNKKDSLILRVRKTNQLICLGWYYVNCENLLCLSLANRCKLSSCGPEEVSWFVKKWSYHRTGGIISRILLEWEKDEGRVWHLVTCNLCTATFGVTSDNTRVTSRNPAVFSCDQGESEGGKTPPESDIIRDGSEEKGAGHTPVYVLLPWWVMSLSIILSEIMWEPPCHTVIIRVLHLLWSVNDLSPSLLLSQDYQKERETNLKDMELLCLLGTNLPKQSKTSATWIHEYIFITLC